MLDHPGWQEQLVALEAEHSELRGHTRDHHNRDVHTPIEETMAALEDARRPS